MEMKHIVTWRFAGAADLIAPGAHIAGLTLEAKAIKAPCR